MRKGFALILALASLYGCSRGPVSLQECRLTSDGRQVAVRIENLSDRVIKHVNVVVFCGQQHNGLRRIRQHRCASHPLDAGSIAAAHVSFPYSALLHSTVRELSGQ